MAFTSVAQSCLTLCNPMDSSPAGFPIPGIVKARIMEWITNSFSRRSFQPRNRTHVSCTAGRLLAELWGKPRSHPNLFFFLITLYWICMKWGAAIRIFKNSQVTVKIIQIWWSLNYMVKLYPSGSASPFLNCYILTLQLEQELSYSSPNLICQHPKEEAVVLFFEDTW